MNNKSLNISDIGLAIITIVLISVSFWQTWIGLIQFFDHAAIFIAFSLSFLLLLLLWRIRSAKIDNKPTTQLLTLYYCIAALCFVANFNAIYTRFMKTDIYVAELKKINTSFNALESDVEEKLDYKYPKEVSEEVMSKKKQLVEQIQDRGNLGIGTRAKSLIRDLEKLLKQPITILEPSNNDYADLALRMGNQIDAMVLNLSSQEAELKEDISKKQLKYNQKIPETVALKKQFLDEVAQKVIDESVNDYNILGMKAQSVLSEEKYKFKPLVSNTNEIGKIGYALTHAFNNFGIYTIMALFGCFILDFLMPIAAYAPARYASRLQDQLRKHR